MVVNYSEDRMRNAVMNRTALGRLGPGARSRQGQPEYGWEPNPNEPLPGSQVATTNAVLHMLNRQQDLAHRAADNIASSNAAVQTSQMTINGLVASMMKDKEHEREERQKERDEGPRKDAEAAADRNRSMDLMAQMLKQFQGKDSKKDDGDSAE